MGRRGVAAIAASDRAAAERGETLLELLVTVMIMGVAVVVLLGGVGTSIRMSGVHREQTTAGAYLRAFGAAVDGAVAASPSGYVECATPASYAGTYALADPGFTAAVLAVRYWDGTAFTTGCTPLTDTGVQQVSLRVSSTDGSVAESLDVIVRKPCRSVLEFPLDLPCG